MTIDTVAIELDQQTRQSLRELAGRRSTSTEALLEEAIKDYLAREADYECQRQDDAERYQHYLDTGEAVDHDRVAEWLDSLATDNPLPPPHHRR